MQYTKYLGSRIGVVAEWTRLAIFQEHFQDIRNEWYWRLLDDNKSRWDNELKFNIKNDKLADFVSGKFGNFADAERR